MANNDNDTTNDQELLEEADDKTELSDENAAEDQLAEAEAKYKRALADYQNLEKRMAEDRREWIRQANRDLLLGILPVLDTLMMAQKHSDDKSLQVSVQQFLDVLKSEGVVRIDATGKKFDPVVMEAVGTAEGEKGKVVDEARAGFMLHERLLRPVQVIVGES